MAAAPSWGNGNVEGLQGDAPGPVTNGQYGHAPLPPTTWAGGTPGQGQHFTQQPGAMAPSWGGGNGQGATQPQPGGAAPSWGPPSASNPTPGQGYFNPQPGGMAPSLGPPTASNPTPVQVATHTVDPNGPLQMQPQQPPPYAGYGSNPPPPPPSSNPLQPNPGEIAGMAPANIQQFGGTPTVNPTYAHSANQQYLTGNAAQINPNSAQSYLNQYGNVLGMGLAPEFQQQQAALAQSNAARGITNSGAAGQLESNLLGQQAGAYANAYAPMVGQAFGYQQSDLTGNAANQQQMALANLGFGNAALGATAGYQQQANLSNQSASNEANLMNANYYNQDRYTNAGAYNSFMNELFGQGASLYGSDTSAYLNSFGPQTGVTNAMNANLQGQQGAYSSVYGQAIGAQQQQEQQAMTAFAAGG